MDGPSMLVEIYLDPYDSIFNKTPNHSSVSCVISGKILFSPIHWGLSLCTQFLDEFILSVEGSTNT